MRAAAFGDRLPQSFWRRWHIDMADPVRAPQRIHDCVHHGRARADRPRLTGPFDAQRVCLARYRAKPDGYFFFFDFCLTASGFVYSVETFVSIDASIPFADSANGPSGLRRR